MKNYLIILFVLFINQTSFCQETGTLKGKIIDQTTKQPIAESIIKVKNTTFETITDSFGEFTINTIPEGNYTIIITANGFQTKEINDVIITRSKVFYIEIEMLNDAKNLEEVTVKKFKN